MSNYIFQVWDKIERKMVASFDSHNEAKQEIKRRIQERDSYWEEYDYEIKKVNSNKVKK